MSTVAMAAAVAKMVEFEEGGGGGLGSIEEAAGAGGNVDDEGETSGESHIEETSGESHTEDTDDDDDDDDTPDTGSPTLDPDARKPQHDEARARRESGGPHDIHKMLAQMGHAVDGVDLNSGRSGSSPAQHGSAGGGGGGGARRPSVAAMAPLRNTFTAKVARGRGGGRILPRPR